MKNTTKTIGFSVTFFLFLLSCNSSINQKKDSLYNGINSQILNIVDSVEISYKEYPFITIWFTAYNDTTFVVRFLNSILDSASTELLEDSIFMGYKKYKSTYLLFYETNKVGNFDKFVKKDSLLYNRIPFEDIDSDEKKVTKISDAVDRVYLIDKNNKLVFMKKEKI